MPQQPPHPPPGGHLCGGAGGAAEAEVAAQLGHPVRQPRQHGPGHQQQVPHQRRQALAPGLRGQGPAPCRAGLRGGGTLEGSEPSDPPERLPNDMRAWHGCTLRYRGGPAPALGCPSKFPPSPLKQKCGSLCSSQRAHCAARSMGTQRKGNVPPPPAAAEVFRHSCWRLGQHLLARRRWIRRRTTQTKRRRTTTSDANSSVPRRGRSTATSQEGCAFTAAAPCHASPLTHHRAGRAPAAGRSTGGAWRPPPAAPRRRTWAVREKGGDVAAPKPPPPSERPWATHVACLAAGSTVTI